MYFNKSKIELIGIVLEQNDELIDLRKQLKFYKRKYKECNEWGSGEEYMSGTIPLKKLLPVLGINKKLK
jgi:hypothetical protein